MELRIQYAKKPGKMAIVKAVKDQAVRRDDIYKSGEIRTGPGEPPNSPSKPTPRGRRVAGRPITSGKLLRPGGPGGQPSKLAHRPARATPAAQPRPMQQQQPAAPQPRQVPQAAIAPQRQSMQPQPVIHQKPQPAAVSAMHSVPSHAHHASNGSASGRVPPPPPPPPAATQAEDTYRAIYEFQGQTQTELALQKDEVVVITQKADNGKFGGTDIRVPSLICYKVGGLLDDDMAHNKAGFPLPTSKSSPANLHHLLLLHQRILVCPCHHLLPFRMANSMAPMVIHLQPNPNHQLRQ